MIRFVVLTGGSNGYPLRAETFSEPPTPANLAGKPSWGWPGKGVRWLPERGKLRDFQGWNGSGPVKVREISPEWGAEIMKAEEAVREAEERLRVLREAHRDVCEIASSRGKPVSVAVPKASE